MSYDLHQCGEWSWGTISRMCNADTGFFNAPLFDCEEIRWGEWELWSECYPNCGAGDQYRHRECKPSGADEAGKCFELFPEDNTETESQYCMKDVCCNFLELYFFSLNFFVLLLFLTENNSTIFGEQEDAFLKNIFSTSFNNIKSFKNLVIL